MHNRHLFSLVGMVVTAFALVGSSGQAQAGTKAMGGGGNGKCAEQQDGSKDVKEIDEQQETSKEVQGSGKDQLGGSEQQDGSEQQLGGSDQQLDGADQQVDGGDEQVDGGDEQVDGSNELMSAGQQMPGIPQKRASRSLHGVAQQGRAIAISGRRMHGRR